MEKKKIKNTVLFGDYKKVKGLPLSDIVSGVDSDEKLDGIILRGYETKFASDVNENGEVYQKGCLDKFINRYFVENGLNMVVDIQHNEQRLCGRVLVIEVTAEGFYFVVYLPRRLKGFEEVKVLLEEKILQGFSKEGWAIDYTFEGKEGEEYMLIKEMEIVSISLVASPANGVVIEKAQEIKNATTFINEVEKDKKVKKPSIFK